VNKASTTSTITSVLPTPSTFGQPVSFTVTIAGIVAGVVPSGSVTLMEGTTNLGSTSTIALIGGVPTATVITAASALTGGVHTISAVYSGDSSYIGSTSGTVTQTVSKATTTTTIAQANPSPSTFDQAVTFTITITPLQGTLLPAGTVTLKEGT